MMHARLTHKHPPRPRGAKPRTRVELAQMQADGSPMPARFCGRWRDKLYYMGQEWTGSSAAIGARKAVDRG